MTQRPCSDTLVVGHLRKYLVATLVVSFLFFSRSNFSSNYEMCQVQQTVTDLWPGVGYTRPGTVFPSTSTPPPPASSLVIQLKCRKRRKKRRFRHSQMEQEKRYNSEMAGLGYIYLHDHREWFFLLALFVACGQFSIT